MREPESDQIEVAEVELSADELQQLSQAQSAEQKPSCRSPASAPKEARVSGRPQAPRKAGLTYAFVAAVALVAGIGALLLLAHEQPSGVQRMARWTPLPESDPTVAEEEPIAVEGKPVRIRNEFDRSEVFEFPAGTSRQEAREQVAQILMRRAMERQSAAQ